MVQSQTTGATKNTILVVDDSTTMRSMVQSFLPQDEFHVQVAKSGQEGLARIHEHCPDLLILDFIMPGMNGYEVYMQLREQPKYANLPIVIMSGSKVEVFNKFAESKAEQKFVFLSKPFDPETLKKQIALALELQFISTTVEDTTQQHKEVSEEVLHEEPARSDKLAPVGEAVFVAESEPQSIVSFEPEVMVSTTDETPLEEEFAVYLSHVPAEMPEMSVTQVLETSIEAASVHELPVEAEQTEHLAETANSAPSYEPTELPMAQIPIEEVSFALAHAPASIMETAYLGEAVYNPASDEFHEIPVAQFPIEETSLNIVHELSLDETALISEDKTVHATPSYEPIEVPAAQMPIEEVSLAPIYVSTTEIAHLSKVLYSSTTEPSEIAAVQVPVEKTSIDEMSMETALLAETVDSLSHEPEMPAAERSLEEPSIDELHELPSETKLDAQTSEEASEISLTPVSSEAMSLNHIQQNLAHILQTETYVMGVLQNLDERVAKDMHSIKNLADQTALLQQEFSYVRGVLNNLNDLPKHVEALKEQVLTQPQAHQGYPDESEQEHMLMVGTHLKNVDSTLMQSVVSLDRLEEIQASLGESLSNSYGQLSDRLTAIERRFEAIVVRSPDPVPVPAPPAAKASMPPLLYITIALGALNFGAMVALLLR